ncbi:MAG: TetR/AcrR family transcriptional regulator [Solirubrobacteraceae bacterium]
MSAAGGALARALTAEVPEDSDHILDAALTLAAASGLRHLTMEDVARGAGVGRMTVYRRFGTRAALIDALAGREARRCLAELDAASPPDAPLEAQVVAGFTTALRITREHPLLARLARVEPESVLAAFTDGDLMGLCTSYLGDRLRRSGLQDTDAVAELLVRVAVSFILLPDTEVRDPTLLLGLLQPTGTSPP